MEIAIIGAGIGGLTTALALKKAGKPFSVFEAADEIKAVGAGIMLAPNAMQVYRYLGIEKRIICKGNVCHKMNITRENLQKLSHADIQPLTDKIGIGNYGIHRAALHEILLKEAGEENILVKKRLKSIHKTENYELVFEDGSSVGAKYIIVADGLNSKVRKLLFDELGLRDSHQYCWRGVTDFKLDKRLHNESYEAWGKGKRFGYIKLNGDQVYWYFLIDDNKANEQSDIMPYLEEFFPLARQLAAATPKENFIIGKLYDLKPIKKWNLKDVCLLGDAAHATTPNLGQGACQAIEDAYVLGRLLEHGSIEEAFEKYPQIRMPKARKIVNTSWRLGKIAHVSNPVGLFLRDSLMKISPESFIMKRFGEIYQLTEV